MISVILGIVQVLGGWRATAFAALAAMLLCVCAYRGYGLTTAGEALTAEQRAHAATAAERDAALERIDGFRVLIGQVNAEADRQVAEAARQRDAARAATETTELQARTVAAELASARAALSRATADPDCSALLKETLCAAVPLL